MKLIGVFFVFFLLFSCSEKQENSVDFNEISDRDVEKQRADKQTDNSVDSGKPEESVFLHAFDSIFPKANWMKWDTLLFVDRFRPKQTEKWILVSDKDSLNLSTYNFKDSIQTRNAFFNWLDCFGIKRQNLVVGSMLKVKGRNLQILVNSTSITVVESSRSINQEKLIKSMNHKVKELDYMYLVDSPIGKKTVWSKMKKNKLLKLERNDKNS
ncbi:MAG: hypothetical protein ACK46Y_14150 [Fluviicola sp.]|jgi:hypothetical protein